MIFDIEAIKRSLTNRSLASIQRLMRLLEYWFDRIDRLNSVGKSNLLAWIHFANRAYYAALRQSTI